MSRSISFFNSEKADNDKVDHDNNDDNDDDSHDDNDGDKNDDDNDDEDDDAAVTFTESILSRKKPNRFSSFRCLFWAIFQSRPSSDSE